MNNVFWIGVYPGLTEEMLEYVAETIRSFVSDQKSGLAILSSADLQNK
jgi:CDP-6-deoxy-D-xylo-4-hexulose-3-dehydrase